MRPDPINGLTWHVSEYLIEVTHLPKMLIFNTNKERANNRKAIWKGLAKYGESWKRIGDTRVMISTTGGLVAVKTLCSGVASLTWSALLISLCVHKNIFTLTVKDKRTQHLWLPVCSFPASCGRLHVHLISHTTLQHLPSLSNNRLESYMANLSC